MSTSNMPPASLSGILNKSCPETPIDFNQYSERFLWRRILVRMQTKAIADFPAYCRDLQSDSSECEALTAALSIKLSYFMRDEMAFETLERLALIPLIEKLQQQNRQKIALWSAGCSSGEEPYSLAIVLANLLGEKLKHWVVQLDATDANAKLLLLAKTAEYTEKSFQNLKKDYIKDFFSYKDGIYYLDSSICKMVTWRLGNITRSPSSMLYDVILCRNVLVYYTKRRQLELIEHLIEHLKPEGYLMLGIAEMLPVDVKHKLEAVSAIHRIYQRLPKGEGTHANKTNAI